MITRVIVARYHCCSTKNKADSAAHVYTDTVLLGFGVIQFGFATCRVEFLGSMYCVRVFEKPSLTDPNQLDPPDGSDENKEKWRLQARKNIELMYDFCK